MCIRDRNNGVKAVLFDLDDTLLSTSPLIRELEDRYVTYVCLLYTSDAADERSSVDLGGRRIFKKKQTKNSVSERTYYTTHSY